MTQENPQLGQLLLDIGRHGFRLRPHPVLADRIQISAVPHLAEVDALPADVAQTLSLHRQDVLHLLQNGYVPAEGHRTTLLDARLLAWGAAGLSADALQPGGQAWLVIAGECLGGRWPDS
jgi:hypothetical protein